MLANAQAPAVGAAGQTAAGAFSDAVLSALFDAVPDGVAYCRMEYQGLAATDFTVLYSNQGMRQLTGIVGATGKRISVLLPDSADPQQEGMATLARVVETGEPRTFEHYQPTLGKWLSVTAYRPNPGHFVLVCSDVSSKHNVQAEAKRYAEWILESVGEGLCRVDDTGVVTFINPVGAALLGYSAQEMVGRNAHQLFHYAHADGRPYPQETCGGRIAQTHGQPRSVSDEVFWRKDGSSFPVHYVSSPMLVDGRAQGTVVTFRNISEEVGIRKVLLESEVKIRKAQEIAGFGSYMTDLATGLWESSAQLDAIFGVDETFVHDIPGWNLLIDLEFRAPALAHYEDVAAGKCEFRMDYRITRPSDGQKRWVAANGEIERDGAGQPLRLIGTIQDITERKQIESELLRNHDLLNKLADEVPGALFQFKMYPDGRFCLPFASQGIREMFGVTPEEILEDAYQAFKAIPEEHRTSFIESIETSARTLENWVQVFQVDLPEQGLKWRQAQSRPELQADGSIIWYGFVADASERVDAKTELLHLNETLESRVLSRTRELATALDTAELAKRSRGQFLANMSHEIRTPMNTVMGMVHLALRTQPAPPLRQYLEKIQQSGTHLLTMINDILDFSKMDAGKLQLELDTFDVDDMLQHIIHLTEGNAIEKGLSLRLDLSPEVPRFVHSDALRLSQILINYLNNAIKFTERGGIVIRVLALPVGLQSPVDARICRVRFEVQDTGIGVDEAQGTRLFNSFEQGDNSTTRKFGGTGLGLAISHQLATLMQGTVGVSSTLGAGSTFWFEVPLEIAPEPDYESIPSPDVAGALRLLRGRRVLVVDDNDFNLDVAKGLLQEAAMVVEVARNGAQALAAMLQSAFDCVLMDVQMPVMDGLEATQRIRSTPALARTVVIAMTANAGQEDRSLCLAAGMNEVIVKPVDPDVLYVALAKWMDSRDGRALGAPRAAQAPAASVAAPKADLSHLETVPVWDEAALPRIVGNNQTALLRLLSKYQTTAREIVADMRRCAEHSQWSQAADLAHKLKSSSRSVGAMRLGGLCEALERAGRSENAAACAALVLSVDASFAEVDARIGA